MVSGVKTLYAVLLALVLGVGCASTSTTEEESSSFNLDHLQMWPNVYEGEGPFVEVPADIGGFLGIVGGVGVLFVCSAGLTLQYVELFEEYP